MLSFASRWPTALDKHQTSTGLPSCRKRCSRMQTSTALIQQRCQGMSRIRLPARGPLMLGNRSQTAIGARARSVAPI